MPWTDDNPPPPAENWTEDERRACAEAANAVLDEGGSEEDAIYACIAAAGKSEEPMSDTKAIKSFPVFVLKADGNTGIVDAIVAVMGNIDHGNDIIHNGSFTKTITERGLKVRVLDNHNSYSLMNVIGKPVEMREVSKAQLPAELLAKHPDATGGLYTKTQYLLDTPEGMGAFLRIKSRAVDEYSIGFRIIRADWGKVKRRDENGDEREITVRHIREIMLFEYSPVIWAMNEATTTVSAKNLKENLPALQAEKKERSMSEQVRMVVDAFDMQGFDGIAPMHNYFIVKEVFEDRICVKALRGVEVPYPYYELGYIEDEEANTYRFDPFEMWVGGDYRFVPGEKGRDIHLTEKQVKTILEHLVKDLITGTPASDDARRDSQQDETDAAPPDAPARTSDHRKRLLKLIELELEGI